MCSVHFQYFHFRIFHLSSKQTQSLNIKRKWNCVCVCVFGPLKQMHRITKTNDGTMMLSDSLKGGYFRKIAKMTMHLNAFNVRNNGSQNVNASQNTTALVEGATCNV